MQLSRIKAIQRVCRLVNSRLNRATLHPLLETFMLRTFLRVLMKVMFGSYSKGMAGFNQSNSTETKKDLSLLFASRNSALIIQTTVIYAQKKQSESCIRLQRLMEYVSLMIESFKWSRRSVFFRDKLKLEIRLASTRRAIN